MNKKLFSTPTALFLLVFFAYLPLQGQETIRFKTQRTTDVEAGFLQDQFKAYTIATLNTETVSNLLRSTDYFPELLLEIDDQQYTFNLRAKDIRAPHYKLRASTPEGVIEVPRSPNKTYYGFTSQGNYDVRVTADDDFFNALIVQAKDDIYIEPILNFIPGAPKNRFVIYKGSDNLKKMNKDGCGAKPGLTHQDHSEDDHNDTPEQSTSGRACKVVQIALADDYRMFDDYGSIDAVEDHNLAVINNVETNFDFEFNDDLQFSIVEIFVATSPATDPWDDSNDIYAVLDDFTDWGPSGFSNTHDVASLWSARNFNGDVIGVAWLNAVCTNFRYNVLEDFTGNAALLRVLQAHEMGHNFSANHDAPNSGFIMAPSVSNTNNWSNASINSIDSYINSINCLGPCGVPLPPVADFDAQPTSGCVPLVVFFDDDSANNPTSWLWTFEGGTPASSTMQHPIVTYNDAGTFDVTLKATNAQGSNTFTRTNYITVGDIPFADFDYAIDEFGVDFQNTSFDANSYLWTFGDGGTSTATNPFHEYDEDGVYTVTLTATNACGSDVFVQIIEIITLPYAAFSSDVTNGCTPFEVEFYNLSTDNADTYLWSFPGGTPSSSSLFEPIVLYETPGMYNVSLTVSNEAGDNTHTINNYITVLPQANAQYTYTTNGLQVTFNSAGSTGTSFFWNFGDGNTSTSPNPVHTYAETGAYQVVLTVSNQCGSDVHQLTVAVTGTPEPAFSSNQQSGCAPLVVQFTNQSGGAPTSFSWIFEGGTPGTSNMANPVVTYNTPGQFDVQLTATNSVGSETVLFENYINIAFPTTSAFDVSITGLNASFVNQSDYATSYNWNFGDGFSSTDENPIHTYLADGVYTVTLIATGICGSDTNTTIVTIQTPPQAGFSFQQSGECVPVVVEFANQSSSNSTSFAWTFVGGTPSTSNQANPIVTYNNAGTFNVKLIAYSGGGSDTVTLNNFITIGTVPNAQFLLATDSMTVTFDNQTTGGNSYHWDFGDGQTSTEVDPIHNYASFGIYTIALISTNACGSDTIYKEIELATVPNASFGYSAHSGCAPFSVSFIDQSQNNPTSWFWEFEGGDPATSDLQNPTVLYTQPGDYSVSLKVANGDGVDSLVLSGLIQVGGVPDATFLHEQNENIISLEYQGIDYDSLRWSFGDGRTDTSLNPSVEYTVSGTYQIVLIVFNQCGLDTSSIWVTVTITGTADPNANEAGWQIRPNPFKDDFTLYGEPLKDGDVIVSLLDVHGRLISSEKRGYSSGANSFEFKGDALPQGVILVVIQDKDSRTVLKAVHQ